MAKVEKFDLDEGVMKDEEEFKACKTCSTAPTPEPKKESKAEKKTGKKLAIFAVVLIAVFIISFFSFKFFNQPETISAGNAVLKIYSDTYYTYNSFEFRLVDGLWVTEIFDPKTKNLYRVPLHYGPKDVIDVEVNKDMISILEEINSFRGPDNLPAVFVTYDPYVNSSFVTLSYFELSQNLKDSLKIRTLPTFTRKFDAMPNATIKTCNSTEPVIFLRYVNPPYIDYKGNCLIIQGQDYDMVKAADRALLQFYGVMT